MNLDKTSIYFGILIGIIIGFIVAGIMFIIGVSEVANNLHVQSMNWTVTIPLNETRMIEAMNQSVQR